MVESRIERSVVFDGKDAIFIAESWSESSFKFGEECFGKRVVVKWGAIGIMRTHYVVEVFRDGLHTGRVQARRPLPEGRHASCSKHTVGEDTIAAG